MARSAGGGAASASARDAQRDTQRDAQRDAHTAKAPPPPSSSRINMRARKNRRRAAASLWSQVPPARVIADACGRAVRRSLSTIAGMVALAAVITGGWCAYRFVTTSPRFAIEAIEVHGNAHESADALIARLPVHAGDNIFAASPAEVAAALLADPWVATAEAHRVLPRTLVVEVSEHAAVARVGLDDRALYLVDAGGRPFKRASVATGDGAGLPVISGIARAAFAADPEGTARSIADALHTLDVWRARGDRPAIGELHVGARGELTLRGSPELSEAVAIQLGVPDAELAARLDSFDAAWAELGDAERARARAVHVDTQPDHVTIAFD
jgi:cell division protein FtsQ